MENRIQLDGNHINVTFNQATSRQNLTSGENLAISLGKAKKYFSDLGDAAFIGVDATPTQSSTNAVQSGGTYTALAGKADLSMFTAMSEAEYAQLVTKTEPLYFIYD